MKKRQISTKIYVSNNKKEDLDVDSEEVDAYYYRHQQRMLKDELTGLSKCFRLSDESPDFMDKY